jgi:hypothetical protein
MSKDQLCSLCDSISRLGFIYDVGLGWSDFCLDRQVSLPVPFMYFSIRFSIYQTFMRNDR